MAENFGSGIISIQTDLREAFAMMEGLEYNRRTVTKRVLAAFGTGGRQAIRRNYSKVLHKKTGRLYKSITSYVYRNGSRVVFTNNAESGKNTAKDGRAARYGFMLASGYTIQPKNGKALYWEEGGQKHFSKKVTVRPKDWVEDPIDRYADSADAESRMEKAMQKQVDYWEKRAEKEANR